MIQSDFKLKKIRKIKISKEIPAVGGDSFTETIPLSVLTKQKEKHKIENFDYEILGDIQDFQELDKLYKKKPDYIAKEAESDSDQKTTASTKIESNRTENSSSKQNAPMVKEHKKSHKYSGDLRQEHALKNWKKRSKDWHIVESFLSKKSGKNAQELLMARIGPYRQQMEERELGNIASKTEGEEAINFWKEGMKIGTDLMGLNFNPVRGIKREIERFVYDRQNRPNRSGSYEEVKRNENKEVLKSIDPFYSHQGEFIIAEGKGLNNLQAEKIQRQNDANSTLKNDISETLNDQKPKLNVVAHTHRLFFTAPIGNTFSSSSSIRNDGTVSVHFEWIKTELSASLKLKTSRDKIPRFFFWRTKGVLLPGESLEFPVVFKSAKPGIFSENWKLITNPELPDDQKISLSLQGSALETDIIQSNWVDKLLKSRISQYAAKEVVDLIMAKVMSHKPQALNSEHTVLRRFEEKNKALKLYYHRETYKKLQEIYASAHHDETTKAWNLSVMDIYNLIMDGKSESKSSLTAALNVLVLDSMVRPRSDQELLSVICRDKILKLTGEIVDVSRNLRKIANLPDKVQDFSDPNVVVDDQSRSSSDSKKSPQPVASKDVKKAPPTSKQPDTNLKQAQKTVPGKKLEDEESMVISNPRPNKQLDPALNWSAERKAHELKYYSEMYAKSRQLVASTIDQIVAEWS